MPKPIEKHDALAPESAPERRTFEAWAAEKKTAAWQAAAARAMRAWAIGREVTEAEFDEAVRAAGEIRLGYDLTR
jgi:hypothetical protein